MTYEKRDTATIRRDIDRLNSMLDGLRQELEAAEEREAMASGGVDAVLAKLAKRQTAIKARLVGIEATRAAIKELEAGGGEVFHGSTAELHDHLLKSP